MQLSETVKVQIQYAGDSCRVESRVPFSKYVKPNFRLFAGKRDYGDLCALDRILTTQISVAIVGLLTALAATFLVTDASFWIDEFGTSRIATADSFQAWWNQFINWHDSDMQMPLYHGLMYFWSRLFGFSEYVHRMFNLPFLVISSAVVLSTFCRLPRFALVLLAIATLHPLIVYYIDEARPYVMVYAGSMVSLCAIVRLYAATHHVPGITPYSGWLLTLGLVLLAGSSMLGTPWVVAALAISLYLHARDLPVGVRLIKANWLPYSLLATGLITLLLFYIYTLSRGARAADAFQSNILTLLFSGYELLGVSGVGPGRLELRAEGVAALKDWIGPVVVAATVICAGLLAGLVELRSRIGTRQLLIIGSMALLPAMLIAIAGLLLNWRVLGRHFMPFLPVLISILALGTAGLLSSERRLGRVLGGLVIVTVALSGLSMMAPRHAKDDYQAAAEIANDAIASEQIVWWAAYGLGADYYNLNLNGKARPGEQCREFSNTISSAAFYVSNQPSQCLDGIPNPDVLILSKPDTFDRRRAIRSRIDALGLEQTDILPAFSIWRASDAISP